MFKGILKDIGADALLITDPINMRYISGFKGGEGALYLSENRSVLITDSRYTEAAQKESSFELIEENARHKRTEILLECLQKDNAVKLGYEDLNLTCAQFEKYKTSLKCVNEWLPIGDRAASLRLIKTSEEIACMQEAASIADRAFDRICALIKEGMTELEGAAELEYQMKKLGAADISFSTIFAAGANSSMPHAVPTAYKLKAGDLITMDFGCKVNGYCSDMTRTVALKEPDSRKKEVYNIVLKAQKAALTLVKAGMSCFEADKTARDIIKAEGYGRYFGHALGHSVGLEIHEEPRLSPNDKTLLAAGMIQTIEPGIYIPGEFGVRIEDMILITQEGCMNFTHSPKELIIL